MRKDEDFWLWVFTWGPLLFWLTVSPYFWFGLTIAALISGCALATVGALLHWRSRRDRRRAADARRREVEAHLERARWALMTNLTEADERWLAERHFWVVPVQVALLRAGVEPGTESDSSLLPWPERRHRQELETRLGAARAAFEGIRRTDDFVESVPLDGEPFAASA